jgi:hypothetical protein
MSPRPADGLAAAGRWWAQGSRWLRWQAGQRLGWPAAVGAFALIAAWSLAGIRAEQAERQARHTASTAPSALSIPSNAARIAADPRDAWLAAMPDTRQRPLYTTRLVSAAEATGLVIGATDYGLEWVAPGLVRLRATLPVSGSYAQIRRHIGQVLGQSPYTGLDSLQIERPSGDGTGLQATVRWSLYFRELAP